MAEGVHVSAEQAPVVEDMERVREQYQNKARAYEDLYAKIHDELWDHFLPDGVLKNVIAATREGADECARYDKMMRARTLEAVRFYAAFSRLNNEYQEAQRKAGIEEPEDLQTGLSSILKRSERDAEEYAHTDMLARKSA